MSAPPTALDLRPLTMGELLDRSAALWRANVRALFALTVGVHLVALALGKYYTAELAGLVDAAGLVQGSAPSETRLVPLLAMAVLAMWVYWWLTNCVSLAAAHYLITRMTATPATLGEAVRRMLRRLWTLTGVLLLSGFYGLGYLLLGVLPGALVGGLLALVIGSTGGGGGLTVVAIVLASLLALVGLFAAMLWYLLRFMIAAPVIAAEELGVLGALRRSGQLLSGRIGPGFSQRVKVRATIVVSAMWLVVLAVSTAAQVPTFILQAIFREEGDPFGLRLELGPRIALTLAEVLGASAQAVFSPLSMVLATVFYVDMRVRQEGWDLELKLGQGQP